MCYISLLSEFPDGDDVMLLLLLLPTVQVKLYPSVTSIPLTYTYIHIAICKQKTKAYTPRNSSIMYKPRNIGFLSSGMSKCTMFIIVLWKIYNNVSEVVFKKNGMFGPSCRITMHTCFDICTGLEVVPGAQDLCVTIMWHPSPHPLIHEHFIANKHKIKTQECFWIEM